MEEFSILKPSFWIPVIIIFSKFWLGVGFLSLTITVLILFLSKTSLFLFSSFFILFSILILFSFCISFFFILLLVLLTSSSSLLLSLSSILISSIRLSIFKIEIFSDDSLSVFFKSKLLFWGFAPKNKPNWVWFLLLFALLLLSSFFINILLLVVSKLFLPLLLLIILLLFLISNLIADEVISPKLIFFPEIKLISFIFWISISPFCPELIAFSDCWDKLISLLFPSNKIPPDELASKSPLVLLLVLSPPKAVEEFV